MIPVTSPFTETDEDMFGFPSEEELVAEQTRKHGIPKMFGYSTTTASDSLFAGFGERFDHALAREGEENTFQLQGGFPAAALNFAKLKARIEARNGDIDALNEIFARMWGLELGMVSKIPPIHVEGTDSQPMHHRPYPWEKIIRDVLASKPSASSSERYSSLGFAMASRNDDHLIDEVIKTVGEDMSSSCKRMADIVSREASQALPRTIDLLLQHKKERAILTNQDAEHYANLPRSRISNAYEVPRYNVAGSSINRGISSDYMGPDYYADITSPDRPRRTLEPSEFREAPMCMRLDVAEVLNLAAYITTISSITKPYVHMLMTRVQDPDDGLSPKLAVRLRREYLYDSPAVRELGPYLLGHAFISNVDLILHNMTTLSHWDDMTVKESMWDYLNRRCRIRRLCPVYGGWKDLIIALRDLPEGWTIYYWMRISMGKFHPKTPNGILAPTAAGEGFHLLTEIIKGVRSRAKYWSAYYTAEYKLIEDSLASENDRIWLHDPEQSDPDEIKRIGRYIPPHLRRLTDLEHMYGADEVFGRSGSYGAEQYQRMVEMQTKSKFFNAVEAITHGSHIVVGISNENMCEMLVEFYQARWYSLHKRIKKAKSHGQVFTLGSVQLPDHPWGDLVEDLPGSYHEMLQFTMNLDPAGWTLPPDYLQSICWKGISELWSDICTEIEQVMAYLYEIESGAVEIQDEILAGESMLPLH